MKWQSGFNMLISAILSPLILGSCGMNMQAKSNHIFSPNDQSLAFNNYARGELAILKTMPHLKILKLCRSNVDDSDLSNLAGLQELEELDLSHTDIYGDGLKYLENLRHLRRIDLTSDRKVTGQKLQWLVKIPCLQELYLGNTYYSGPCPIDDSGTVYIGQLTQLKSLNLSGTKITDKGVENLSTLNNLENLYLAGTKVGDRSITVLKQLPRLKQLNLGGTNVTESALPELMQLKGLQELTLTFTKISSSELIPLRNALPNCKIVGRGDYMEIPPGMQKYQQEHPLPFGLDKIQY